MFKKLLIATVGMVGMGYCMVSGDKITQCQMREWDRYAGVNPSVLGKELLP